MRRAVVLALAAVVLTVTLLPPASAATTTGFGRTPPGRVPGEASSWHQLGPVVFTRTLDGDADLWRVRADGSRLEPLTTSRKDDSDPAWAPHGSTIVFARSRAGSHEDLFLLDLKDGRPMLFLRNGGAPAWSPDGDRIAFVRTVDGNTDVYTVAAEGGDLLRVTDDPGVDTDPTWGPGGARLMFASDRDGDFDIYSSDPDGSDVRPITADDVDQGDPVAHWTWRDVGYDQGPEGEEIWCWQTIGVPEVVPGTATSCADAGRHSYAVGTWGPFFWLERGENGRSHLWAYLGPGDDLRLTGGRRSDGDPAVRPATRGVVRRLTRAAGDLNEGLLGAEAWVDLHGTTTGADESSNGLITQAPTLCLIAADDRSLATATTCDAGSSTGSTSVYADEDTIALARDTGLGLCLFALYRVFGSYRDALFGTTGTEASCTGTEAQWASTGGW
jgi:WD40-like Beta Propeller Repeat